MHGQGGTSPLPAAKAKILHGGTFATICRLTSCSFSVTAQGVTFSHPKFSNLMVQIPAGAVLEQNQFEVNMKVSHFLLINLWAVFMVPVLSGCYLLIISIQH